MKTMEFTAVIEFADTDTSVVIEVEYDRMGPNETRVFLPCSHEGCKKHRMEITPLISCKEWKIINKRIPQELLMAEVDA